MKTIIFKLSLVCLTILPFKQLVAQVTISGEIRPRTEFRHGFKTPYISDHDPALFTEQRTRIKLDQKNKKFFSHISLQDVRIWGAVDQIYKSDSSLTAIHQGYAGFYATPKLAISAGRMELNYDNARIFGNLGWAQQSRSHDLIKIAYTDSLWKIHAGAAFNQDNRTPEFKKLKNTFYTTNNNYKTMQYAWFNANLDFLNLSLLAMNQGIQTGRSDSANVEFNQTFGTHSLVKAGVVKIGVEAYIQTGKTPTGTELFAYMLSANVSLKITDMIPITLGVDHLSGSAEGASKNNTFTPFFGTNHKFYGLMDYFYVGNAHSNLGLTDIYLKSKINFSKKIALLIHGHQFMTAESMPGVSDFKKNIGSEIDLILNYNIMKEVNIKIGYSQLFATESMTIIKNTSTDAQNSTHNWAWVMLTVKPVFFKSK